MAHLWGKTSAPGPNMGPGDTQCGCILLGKISGQPRRRLATYREPLATYREPAGAWPLTASAWTRTLKDSWAFRHSSIDMYAAQWQGVD